MLNERQVALRVGGTFASLTEFLNRRIVKTIPFVVTQQLAVSAAQFSLISATELAGTIGVGLASVSNGSYIAAELAGAVGTAATTTIADSNGNILNMVSIRDTNGDEIQEGVGVTAKTIYGLIQCSNGTVDGAAIGAAASENLQISFVYYNAGTLTLATAFTKTIQFQGNKLFLQRNVATIEKETGNLVPDILQRTVTPLLRKFIVTTAFAANEVITLSTGDGATGVSTASGDTMTLPASGAAMLADNNLNILLNGVRQIKQTEFIWDSTTTGHFAAILDIGDYFEIEKTS